MLQGEFVGGDRKRSPSSSSTDKLVDLDDKRFQQSIVDLLNGEQAVQGAYTNTPKGQAHWFAVDRLGVDSVHAWLVTGDVNLAVHVLRSFSPTLPTHLGFVEGRFVQLLVGLSVPVHQLYRSRTERLVRYTHCTQTSSVEGTSRWRKERRC